MNLITQKQSFGENTRRRKEGNQELLELKNTLSYINILLKDIKMMNVPRKL